MFKLCKVFFLFILFGILIYLRKRINRNFLDVATIKMDHLKKRIDESEEEIRACTKENKYPGNLTLFFLKQDSLHYDNNLIQ